MKRLVIILIAIILSLIIFKDLIVKYAVSHVGSSVLGAQVKIGSFGWDVFAQKIHIRDLSVFNPPGFPHRPLISISAADVNYDLSSLLKGKLYFSYIHVDVKEMVIIKNAQGKLNVDALKVSQKSPNTNSSQASSPAKPLLINVLELSLERTVYMDYTQGNQPTVKNFNVGFKDKTFRNIKSVQQLAVLILTQAMSPAAIKTAAIYGVATILGIGFLPVGIAAELIHQLSDHLK